MPVQADRCMVHQLPLPKTPHDLLHILGDQNDVDGSDRWPIFHDEKSHAHGDLSDWNVAKVDDMQLMFYGTSAFNGDLGDWDVSSVTNMRAMCKWATPLEEPPPPLALPS